MNYCLNIYDQGSIVSIVCDISSHGTHVAGITSACHPGEPLTGLRLRVYGELFFDKLFFENPRNL